jgi:hypothetical protein
MTAYGNMNGMIDPKQIARMITEDPDEINPLDDIEDTYFPSQDNPDEHAPMNVAFDEMHAFGEIIADYLNYNHHSPADFTDFEDMTIHGGPDDAMWSVDNQNFSYGHPVYQEFMGAVYYDDDRIWKYEWQDHA